ncbi:MAG: hypothetical protein JWN37_139 [Candidatus Nomurabacteria bacterium]|nr:hypothetical protein [Candidatus Nomurabacteria bacterium]
MNKLNTLFAVALAAASFGTQAQMVVPTMTGQQQGSAPNILVNGQWNCPQGHLACSAGQSYAVPMIGNQPVFAYGNQTYFMPQGVQYGQPFTANMGGRRVRCSLSDRGMTGLVDGAAAALFGGVVAKFTRHKFVDGAKIGGAVGVAYGLTYGCDPYIVNDGDEGRIIQTSIPMRPAATFPANISENGGNMPVQLGGSEFSQQRTTVQRQTVPASLSPCSFPTQGVVAYVKDKPTCDRLTVKPELVEGAVATSSSVVTTQSGSTATQTSSASVTRTVVPAARPAENGVDLWKWKPGKATSQNPMACVVEKLINAPNPPFCSEMKVLAPVAGETRDQWALRAEKL